MNCKNCGQPCGERDFCGDICYEQFLADMEAFYKALAETEEDSCTN
jgi:hypothetical protein